MRTLKSRTIAASIAVVAIAATAWLIARCGRGEERRAGVGPSAPAAVPRRASAPTEEPARPADARPLALVTALAERDPAARHGAIAGRVMNGSSGQPVAGAEITLALDDRGTATLTSDADGSFQFEPTRVEERVTVAAITAAGYLPFAPEWGHSPIALRPRAGVRVRDVVIYLTPALDYTGVVVAPDGHPVAGAKVRIVDLPAAEQELVSIPDRFVSDARGEFVFHAPDDALLEARAPGHGPGRARLDGAAQTSRRLTLRLTTAGDTAEALGSASVTGVVLDAGGAPLPGAIVRAEPAPGPRTAPADRHLAAAARAVTGDDGRFRIDGLDPGSYQVSATDLDRAPASELVSLAAGGTRAVTLTLTAGAQVTGEVRSSGGAAVAAFTVVVTRMTGLRGEVLAVRTVVDPDGAFTVDGLPAGEVRVQATAHGHAPSRPVAGRAVVPPERPAPISLALPGGGTLTGIVRAQGGGPLENARVTVEGGLGDGSSAVPFAASAATDAGGRFTLRGLAPGRRSVMVGAFAHHGTILGGLDIVDGAVLGPIEIALRPVAEGEQPTVELAGIGAALTAAEDALVVERAIPGGGAEAAGLSAGDLIVSVDAVAVTELGFDGAIQAIRGPVGTTVRIGLRKRGAAEVREVPVERRKIVAP